ncbi:MAG: tripartite tricarboxylate transporter substrate binding protein, partial [Burkholderiales bacterium]|nr:tripartite tricarboxylate transporter substrate binding protein [Burkholderiales bacterium]
TAAHAQAWPARAVTVVSPYPPGGTNDVVARALADRLAPLLGVPVVVENRPGAAGIVGSLSVVRAAPDGHTLLVANNGSHIVQPLVSSAAKYDPLRDFTPVARLVTAVQFFAVNSDLPVKTMAEFIALARREPGRYFYGSSGSGSVGNFSGEWLRLVAGIDVTHVPFKGSAQALTELMAGRVHFMIDPLVLSQVKSGRVRVIATTSPERFPGHPDVPTMRESGLAEFDMVGWFGLFAPPQLPREVLARLSEAAIQAMSDGELKARLPASGVLATPLGPDAFAALIRADQQRFADIKRRANIQVVE